MKTEDRFSNRVQFYVKYRPAYPDVVYSLLLEKKLLKPDDVVADIGSGTGISSELFLKHGHQVFGIEPNLPMLNASKEYLKNYTGFKPLNAKAENTSLDNSSVDLIVVAQTFHWLDQQQAKEEFKRILKPDGKVLLMWNDRRTGGSDFLKVYEDFLKMFGTDYIEVDHKKTQQAEVFEKFFGGPYNELSAENSQLLDFEGLKGRVLSSSYMPDEQHTDYSFMLYCLKKIFQRYQEKNMVRLLYDTRLYIGSMK